MQDRSRECANGYHKTCKSECLCTCHAREALAVQYVRSTGRTRERKSGNGAAMRASRKASLRYSASRVRNYCPSPITNRL